MELEHTASFGYWLRRRRKARDMTQETLAHLVGCAVSTIKKLECDERRPSRDMAARLAGILAIPPEERERFMRAARAELATQRLGLISAPLAAPAPPLSNLPAPASVFIGRQPELAAVRAG